MNEVRALHAEKIIERARVHFGEGDFDLAWKLLEDAHIFSQPFAALHLYVHFEMLLLAYKTKNIREMWGQTLRLLLAVPTSALRQYPVGNSGRSNMGMFSSAPLEKRISVKLSELHALERKRIDNGGVIPKYQRQHPISRR